MSQREHINRRPSPPSPPPSSSFTTNSPSLAATTPNTTHTTHTTSSSTHFTSTLLGSGGGATTIRSPSPSSLPFSSSSTCKNNNAAAAAASRPPASRLARRGPSAFPSNNTNTNTSLLSLSHPGATNTVNSNNTSRQGLPPPVKTSTAALTASVAAKLAASRQSAQSSTFKQHVGATGSHFFSPSSLSSPSYSPLSAAAETYPQQSVVVISKKKELKESATEAVATSQEPQKTATETLAKSAPVKPTPPPASSPAKATPPLPQPAATPSKSVPPTPVPTREPSAKSIPSAKSTLPTTPAPAPIREPSALPAPKATPAKAPAPFEKPSAAPPANPVPAESSSPIPATRSVPVPVPATPAAPTTPAAASPTPSTQKPVTVTKRPPSVQRQASVAAATAAVTTKASARGSSVPISPRGARPPSTQESELVDKKTPQQQQQQQQQQQRSPRALAPAASKTPLPPPLAFNKATRASTPAASAQLSQRRSAKQSPRSTAAAAAPSTATTTVSTPVSSAPSPPSRPHISVRAKSTPASRTAGPRPSLTKQPITQPPPPTTERQQQQHHQEPRADSLRQTEPAKPSQFVSSPPPPPSLPLAQTAKRDSAPREEEKEQEEDALPSQSVQVFKKVPAKEEPVERACVVVNSVEVAKLDLEEIKATKEEEEKQNASSDTTSEDTYHSTSASSKYDDEERDNEEEEIEEQQESEEAGEEEADSKVHRGSVSSRHRHVSSASVSVETPSSRAVPAASAKVGEEERSASSGSSKANKNSSTDSDEEASKAKELNSTGNGIDFSSLNATTATIDRPPASPLFTVEVPASTAKEPTSPLGRFRLGGAPTPLDAKPKNNVAVSFHPDVEFIENPRSPRSPHSSNSNSNSNSSRSTASSNMNGASSHAHKNGSSHEPCLPNARAIMQRKRVGHLEKFSLGRSMFSARNWKRRYFVASSKGIYYTAPRRSAAAANNGDDHDDHSSHGGRHTKEKRYGWIPFETVVKKSFSLLPGQANYPPSGSESSKRGGAGGRNGGKSNGASSSSSGSSGSSQEVRMLPVFVLPYVTPALHHEAVDGPQDFRPSSEPATDRCRSAGGVTGQYYYFAILFFDAKKSFFSRGGDGTSSGFFGNRKNDQSDVPAWAASGTATRSRAGTVLGTGHGVGPGQQTASDHPMSQLAQQSQQSFSLGRMKSVSGVRPLCMLLRTPNREEHDEWVSYLSLFLHIGSIHHGFPIGHPLNYIMYPKPRDPEDLTPGEQRKLCSRLAKWDEGCMERMAALRLLSEMDATELYPRAMPTRAYPVAGGPLKVKSRTSAKRTTHAPANTKLSVPALLEIVNDPESALQGQFDAMAEEDKDYYLHLTDKESLDGAEAAVKAKRVDPTKMVPVSSNGRLQFRSDADVRTRDLSLGGDPDLFLDDDAEDDDIAHRMKQKQAAAAAGAAIDSSGRKQGVSASKTTTTTSSRNGGAHGKGARGKAQNNAKDASKAKPSKAKTTGKSGGKGVRLSDSDGSDVELMNLVAAQHKTPAAAAAATSGGKKANGTKQATQKPTAVQPDTLSDIL